MSRTVVLCLLAAELALVSCSAVGEMGRNSLAVMKKTGAATASKVSELSEMAMDKVRPAGVKVVEVREKDLKEMQTGQEKALAYEHSRKRSFWFFGGPVDFKEPSLPEAGGEMDGTLLPPKAE